MSRDLLIRAGELTRRIEVLQNRPVKNALGETIDEWVSVGKWWAKVEPTGGREVIRGMQIAADVTHLIEMRYTDQVTPARRIRYGTRIFDVGSAINIEERGIKLVVMARERPAAT